MIDARDLADVIDVVGDLAEGDDGLRVLALPLLERRLGALRLADVETAIRRALKRAASAARSASHRLRAAET